MAHWSQDKDKRKRVVRKLRAGKLGAKNPQWNDADPSYGSVHTWLFKNHRQGKKKCAHCGSDKKLEFALKKGETHSHAIEKYLILCSSCHKKYDYTPERREKMRKAMTGRKITWDLNVAHDHKGRFTRKT